MRTLQATVRPGGTGFVVAGRNLAHVTSLITARTGLPGLIPGAINLALNAPYIVISEATISAPGYNGLELIKLQRCLLRRVKAVIMRPHTHELSPPWGHGPAHLEVLSHCHLRTTLGLSDNEAVDVEVEGPTDWWEAGK